MSTTNNSLDMLHLLSKLQTSPGERSDYIERARLLFQLAQFEAALQVLGPMENDPVAKDLRCRCYQNLSHWSLEIGDLETAEAVSEQQLRECGGSFGGYALRGEIASAKGNDVSALGFFSNALAMMPRDQAVTPDESQELNRILYLRVASLVRLSRYEEAFEHWRAVIKRDENNSDLWYLGALCLVNVGRLSEAASPCQRALELDPQHIDAGKLRAQLTASG